MSSTAGIRRILCPSDFSPLSRRALDLAVAVAQEHDAELRAVHVMAPVLAGVSAGPLRTTPARFEVEDPRALLGHIRAGLQEARALGVRVDAAVLEGDVTEEILRQASEWPADLLVMGTRRAGAEQAWAVGSVTEAVLPRAPCPVLMVRGDVGVRRAANPFARILCPSDFSEPSRLALEYALRLGRGARSRLTLLHVLKGYPEEGPADLVHLDVSEPEYSLDLTLAARERLRRAVPEAARAWCELEEAVAVGRPHREILRVARESQADLIVLGVHCRRAHDRSLSGMTLCHVVREASCPVLAVRAPRGGKE